MEDKILEKFETEGDVRLFTSVETPLRQDTFDKTDDEKVENIQRYFGRIMEELGLDLTDDGLSGTPYRVAKMYVKELFYGLKPKRSAFENKYGYGKMLVEQNITIDYACKHHFLPITGFAHITYLPEDRVVGLSKINRLVNYYAHRPQVQERLCLQIIKDLQQALDTQSVMVMISAKHLCVSSRGIKDKSSYTTTIEYNGEFNKQEIRNEFFNCLSEEIN